MRSLTETLINNGFRALLFDLFDCAVERLCFRQITVIHGVPQHIQLLFYTGVLGLPALAVIAFMSNVQSLLSSPGKATAKPIRCMYPVGRRLA